MIFPTEHSLLWEFGPARVRKSPASSPETEPDAPLGASQVAFGIWLAKRQYHGR